MVHELQLRIPSNHINNQEYINEQICRELNIRIDDVNHIEILKRSIDARKKDNKYNLKVAVYVGEDYVENKDYFHPKDVTKGKEVVIIGAGPAGMYAALYALEKGLKPIIYERGKDVRTRRRDLKSIHQDHKVDSDSNYCFGEGGAGAYSDGKLYTRSNKRGNVKKVLEVFVQHGASKDILIDSHPHIGSNILPKVVSNIRQVIIDNGGEIYFNSKVTDFIIVEDEIKGAIVNDEKEIMGDAVILATGHSARDIYYLL